MPSFITEMIGTIHILSSSSCGMYSFIHRTAFTNHSFLFLFGMRWLIRGTGNPRSLEEEKPEIRQQRHRDYCTHVPRGWRRGYCSD